MSERLSRTSHRLCVRFESALERLALADRRVVAAVSGGGDSMALLELLSLSAADRRLCVTVACYDHALRPTSSFETALVSARAAQLGFPFVGARGLASQGRDEATLRAARYAWLDEMAAQHKADTIVTAHSADDQVETVLLRLLRGAGTGGLAAMSERRDRIVRPLLRESGRDLRCLLRERGVAWVEDGSNRDLSYRRNWLRHEILPRVEKEFGAGALASLARRAESLRADEEYLRAESARYGASASRGPAEARELDLLAVSEMAPAIRARVLRGWLVERGFNGPVELRHLDALETLLDPKSGEGPSVDLPGLGVERQGRRLRVRPATPQAGSGRRRRLAAPTGAC